MRLSIFLMVFVLFCGCISAPEEASTTTKVTTTFVELSSTTTTLALSTTTALTSTLILTTTRAMPTTRLTSTTLPLYSLLPECDRLQFQYERDYCYMGKAVASSDSRLCEGVRNIYKRFSCFSGVANKTGDFLLCERIPLPKERSQCFEGAGRVGGILACEQIKEQLDKNFCCNGAGALAVNDLSICKKIGELKDTYLGYDLEDYYSYYDCYTNVAVALKSLSICDKITMPTSEYNYYMEIHESMKNLSMDENYTPDTNYTYSPSVDYYYCYTAVAAAMRDISICKNVSNISIRRDECYSGVAAASNNLSICNSMESEPSDYFEGDDEFEGELLNLTRDMCYSSVAVASNNLSICNSIGEEYIRGDCYQGLINKSRNPSICDKIPAGFVYMDSCLRDFCIKLKNLSICDRISANSTFVKADGFQILALELNNMSLCDATPDNYYQDCYHEFGLDKADLSMCAKAKRQIGIDLCYNGVAEAVGDESICEKIQDADTIGECYYNVVYHKDMAGAVSESDVSICDKIQDNKYRYRDWCLLRVFYKVNSSDLAFCDKMTDPSLLNTLFLELLDLIPIHRSGHFSYPKDLCYLHIANITKNTSLCDKIVLDDDRWTCYDETSA
ncbi:MAG: hypothetical protein V1703_02840 [Candidatus Altiarchaeota archaeon]